MTDIEVAMSEILKDMAFRYYEQYPVGKYIVDFFIPEFNLAIEADGEPWHAEVRDRERDLGLMNEFGIRVMHFKGRDILKNPKRIRKEIMEEMEKTVCVRREDVN